MRRWFVTRTVGAGEARGSRAAVGGHVALDRVANHDRRRENREIDSPRRFLNQSPPLNRHQLCKVLILIYIKIYIDMYRTKDMRQERNN